MSRDHCRRSKTVRSFLCRRGSSAYFIIASAFAPPPKHVGYHGAAAVDERSPSVSRGLGAPLPRETIQQQEQARYRQQEEEEPRPPPMPYRVNTTGIDTTHLPKPPVRRGDTSTPPTPGSASGRPPPGLPPRLPARQNSNPNEYTPAPPPAYHEAVVAQPSSTGSNQASLDRLGRAGVSVSGLDIGRTASPLRTPAASSPSTTQQGPQLSELQSRFSRMSASSPTSEAPAQGTTWAQKQAALKTAQNARNDPSSLTLADARSTASTVNNFRQRHGEQVASGMQTANGLNQKYGVTNRFNSMTGNDAGSASNSPTGLAAAAAKKAPPPPPPKKKELSDGSHAGPPPLPLSSKPRP